MCDNTNWFDRCDHTSFVKTLFSIFYPCDLFKEWKKVFFKIHGSFDTQRKINIAELEKTYHISLNNDREILFKLIFCLETYYSILLRIIAYKSLNKATPYSTEVFNENSYKDKGVSNYTFIPYYDWFLTDNNFVLSLSIIYNEVQLEYEGDLISYIFENIFPKEIRHSIGEYYTPYWLAKYVIDKVTSGDDRAQFKKYIDPSCGSGTFIVALLKAFKQSSHNMIFNNVCGIDVNPLTVLAAKTNFLLLYSTTNNVEIGQQIRIPIYHADVIAINDNQCLLFDNDDSYESVPNIQYDYIVGNPPWVNWEYLPDHYRINHAYLWKYYNLFSQKGLNAGFVKEDISVLLTYLVIDKYLSMNGKIGFILKETLFKSIKQGEGFRNFKITPSNTELKVLCVDDLTNFKPFKDAVTRAAIVYIQKGEKTVYPVNYVVWKPKRKTGIENNIMKITDCFDFVHLKASPSIKESINSNWITETPSEREMSTHILGKNDYKARTGVFTGGANGIFWLNIECDNGNDVLVSNITDRGKNKFKSIKAMVEKDFIFPLLTGSDLNFWSYSYSKYILCPHTPESRMYPIDINDFEGFQKTRRYLEQFKEELTNRKGFTSIDKPIHDLFYYTLQRIGTYTFAPYKVCWRYISKHFTPAVVKYATDKYLGYKNIIGNEKIISIGFDSADEAYYVCGVISSTPYKTTIENFMVGTQITPSVINRLSIPKFDPTNDWQMEISNLCKKGHSLEDKTSCLKKINEIIEDYLKKQNK